MNEKDKEDSITSEEEKEKFFKATSCDEATLSPVTISLVINEMRNCRRCSFRGGN